MNAFLFFRCLGIRIAEETNLKPKPMIEISKRYSVTGFDIRLARNAQLRVGQDSTREIEPREYSAAMTLASRAEPKQLRTCNVFTGTLWAGGIYAAARVAHMRAAINSLLKNWQGRRQGLRHSATTLSGSRSGLPIFAKVICAEWTTE